METEGAVETLSVVNIPFISSFESVLEKFAPNLRGVAPSLSGIVLTLTRVALTLI